MRKEYLITFRSVTFAQHAQRVLQREHIFCQLRRTPKILTSRGCGYCLWLRERDVSGAVALLHSEQISYGKVFELGEDGLPQEWAL